MSKKYRLVLGGFALVAVLTTTFFVAKQEVKAFNLPFFGNTKLTEEEIINRGLNEYVDPSQYPYYDGKFNEIHFGEEGITYDELLEFSEVVDIVSIDGDTPKAIMKAGDEKLVQLEVSKDRAETKSKFNNEKSKLKEGFRQIEGEKNFEEGRIYSITFNTSLEDTLVDEINHYRGKDENLEMLKEKKVELEKNL